MIARRPAVFLALILALAPAAAAAETGAAFLKIGVGARAIGMGSAFTARADDATAAYWNPAGLAQIGTRQVSAMHTQWIADTQYENLAYAHPTKRGTFAGSLALFSQGNMERRDENRRRQGDFDAQDSALGISFGGRLSARAAYGLGVKAVRQSIDENRASGVAADFGFLQKAGPGLTFGLALQNLGPSMKFIERRYDLPLSLTVGADLRIAQDLRAGLDVQRLIHEKRTAARLGTEYWLMGRVALRAGYMAHSRGAAAARADDASASRLGTISGLQMGIGLALGRYQMDYALVPAGELGNTQRLSLTFSF